MKKTVLAIVAASLVVTLTACGGTTSNLSGQIDLDGSSTVFPIMEAVTEEFNAANPDVRVALGSSGTGGGFERFCKGETAISNASREIKAEEAEACGANNVEFVELEIAYDGLSVIVNKENDWVDQLTLDELKKIFAADSTAKTWADVRTGFPATPLKIFSPGADSGTFDYFTKEVNGEEGSSRTDGVTFSEDDNALVTGIEGDPGAIGYFGFAYYVENKDQLKLVPVVGDNGAVAPTHDTIRDGSYAPLSRPLFIYVNTAKLEDEATKAYVEFALDNAIALSEEVGYVGLTEEAMEAEAAKIE